MADEADVAFETSQASLNQALHYRKTEQKITHTGYCHNPSCCLDVEPPKLFCDNVCAGEYERFQKRKAG